MISSIQSGKTYLISIAIADYDDKNISRLPSAVNDSNKVIEILLDKYKVELHEKIHNTDFTSRKIADSFLKLKQKITKNDSLLVFYNGHGNVLNGGFYMPFVNSSSAKNMSDWYSFYDFQKQLKEVEDLKGITLFINGCMAGNLFQESSLIRTYSSVNSNKSRIIFTSGNTNEPVDDGTLLNLDNSPFIDTIVEVLRNNASSYEIAMSTIITYTKAKFRKEEYKSNPTDGYFEGHNGGDFFLYLKEDEHKRWKDVNEEDRVEEYDDFIRNFPSSQYKREAENRRNELITERKEWLGHLTNAFNKFQEFTENRKLNRPKYLKEAKELLKHIDKIKSDLTKDDRAIEEWEKIKTSSDIVAFTIFIEKFPTSKYAGKAKLFIEELKKRAEAKEAWQDIPDKRTPPKNRKARFLDYITSFPYSSNFSEAELKLKDISYWIEITKEKSPHRKKEKIELYLDTFSNGEYRKEATNELEDLNIEKKIKKLNVDFEDAKKNANYAKLSELKSYVEGTSKEEQSIYKECYQQISKEINNLDLQRERDYHKAINEDSIDLIVEFIQKYNGSKYAQELQDKFHEIDEKSYGQAEQSKEKDDYEAYLLKFQDNNGKYIIEVQDRLEELNYYEGLTTIEELKKYLDLYQGGVKREEADHRIKSLIIEKNREELYHSIKANPTKELCKDFLSEYDDEDGLKENVKSILLEIERKEKEGQLYQEILQYEGDKQQNSCKEYIDLYPEGDKINSVRQILLKVQANLKDEEAFIDAKKSGESSKLEEYKANYPNGLYIDKAEDCIFFLKIENTNNINELKSYLQKFPNGMNRNKAEERIFFLKAKEQDAIESYKVYCEQYPNGTYIDEIKTLLEQGLNQKQEKEAFNKAKQEDTIEAFKNYLSTPHPHTKEHLEYAKKRRRELVNLEKEKEFFQKIMAENSEKLCINYIQQFGYQGLYVKEVSQRLNLIQTGKSNTDKEKETWSLIVKIVVALSVIFFVVLLIIAYFLWNISSKML
ncbi:caspase family protein [Aureispira sp. CCB-QB1]|uniref:caspase family protein n=1 Tax=Aureispira sp. CCB-QB1 TaxID=1313421 RepID=UPI0006963577|nr:caspase family protein [Aureispira sp. CCB-QB1]